jgi:hypothetical protein
MSDMKFSDDEVYPPEASARGDNAFYLDGCAHVGSKPPYASCLKKMTDRKNGRLDAQWAECSAAIGKKVCPALAMREKELEKGLALFYINRSKLRLFSQYQAELGEQILFSRLSTGKSGERARRTEREPTKAPAFAPAKTPYLDDQENGYAAAINSAIAETQKEPVAKQERPPMLPGESLMAYARRVRESQASA